MDRIRPDGGPLWRHEGARGHAGGPGDEGGGGTVPVGSMAMGMFRRRRTDLGSLLERRAQLVAELEVVDADAAWASVSDDRGELADARSLRRQTDALRRALADLDRQIGSEQNRL